MIHPPVRCTDACARHKSSRPSSTGRGCERKSSSTLHNGRFQRSVAVHKSSEMYCCHSPHKGHTQRSAALPFASTIGRIAVPPTIVSQIGVHNAMPLVHRKNEFLEEPADPVRIIMERYILLFKRHMPYVRILPHWRTQQHHPPALHPHSDPASNFRFIVKPGVTTKAKHIGKRHLSQRVPPYCQRAVPARRKTRASAFSLQSAPGAPSAPGFIRHPP